MENHPALPLISQQILLAENAKRYITPMFWPRLLLIQVRLTAVALCDLIRFTNKIMIDGLPILNLALSTLGWALHGIRLLINIERLLVECLPSEQGVPWHQRFILQSKKTFVEMGNDGIWIMKAIIPSSNILTASLLVLLGIAWEGYCLSREYDRLNKAYLTCEKETRDTNLSPEVLKTLLVKKDHAGKLLAHTRKMATFSGVEILCTTLLFVTKAIIIPLLFPAIALNPVIPLVFACLALLITVMRRVIDKWLACQKPVVQSKLLGSNAPLPHKPNLGFFKNKLLKIDTNKAFLLKETDLNSNSIGYVLP